jgi:drug/metabolite transporter (DMT)-like permease
VDAVRGGNLLNLESAWGLLFGLIFYGEWPSWRGLLGGVLIVGSVLGLNLYARRAEAKLALLKDHA